MPTAPPRPCPKCHRLISGRCPTCTRARDISRGSASARGYGTTWAAYSRAWLASYPYCGQRIGGVYSPEHSRCTQRGEHVRATVTDHIRSLRNGGALFDGANHQSLCASCNAAKDAQRGPRT
jgi:5-methylcytosine-specific restriction endonuclease McrA